MKKMLTAFTLVEILVVVSVIALLLAVLLPVMTRARQLAYRIRCLNNLKQLGLAVESYTQSYNYYPVCVPEVDTSWEDFLAAENELSEKMLGVPVSLFPFHESQALYDCPVLSKADCDISYCYNWHAGKVFDESEPFVSLFTSEMGPIDKPKPEIKNFLTLRPEKVKSPAAFVILYDQPVIPEPITIIGGYNSYKDIDPDDYISEDYNEKGLGHLWHYKVLEVVGPHQGGHNILFGDGHVKWYKDEETGEDKSIINRNPF
ncbi:MAG: DUF1559 domain-containing protein [Sedimentisphaerales bacterium]|nr:DUF1559 domain-containing protein [Sedimentisphaerales bacterium]